MRALQPSRRSRLRSSDVIGAVRRGMRPAAVVCIGVAILILITLSPLALGFIAGRRQVDWTRLGNVGQAYGAISAVLSALALVAVSVSLALQAKESLANRRQVHRNIHMKLAEMAMSDPLYMKCWGPGAETAPHDESRLRQFLNLMVSFWYMQWELKDIKDHELTSLAANGLFQTDAGRKFWIGSREHWTENSVGSRLNKFCEIMDEALSSALRAQLDGTETPSGDSGARARRSRDTIGMISAAATALSAAVVVHQVLRRGRRH